MKRVVVFGSNILDMFFEIQDFGFFTKTGIGAEDALHFRTHTQAPGGKGANQAVAAAHAGAKVKFYGALGKGAHARYILDNFKSFGIDTKGIAETDEPTGVATIFTKPNGKHKIIVSQGANGLARQSQIPDKMLDEDTILLLQAELNPKENEALMLRGKKRGAQIILNIAPAKPVSRKALKSVDYLIVNEPEAEALAVHLGLNAKNLESAARTIAKTFDLMCIVTLGEKGSIAYTPDSKKSLYTPALRIKAKDTVGAGDAFAGAFAASLARGADPVTALQYAAVAGSLACTKMGAQTALPSEAEIKRALPQLRKALAKG